MASERPSEPAAPAGAAESGRRAGAAPSRSAQRGLATLGLPLQAVSSVWLATLALATYYVATLARDLSLYDSGELALAAVQLGLGHPPGQPLHSLLGFALSQLPGIPKLFGVGLASALPAALTLLPATSLAQSLAGPHLPASAQRWLPWWMALIALHASLWEPATRVEVYALSSCFALWACARLAGQTDLQHSVVGGTGRAVFEAGLALGLCASVNPVIAVCAGVAVAPAILLRIARGRTAPRALGLAIAGGVLGLLPYAYVLLVAQRHDVMVWGAPRDAASLWRYLLLRDYAHNQQIDAAHWLAHGIAWLRWSGANLLLPLLAAGLLGHLWLGRHAALGRLAYPIALVLLVADVSFNVVWNLDIPDYNGYLATALWLAAAGAAALAAVLLAERRTLALVLIASLALASLLAPPHLLERSRARDHLARELAEQVLREAPAGALVIAKSDHLAGALFYLQEAEHQRPDVAVLVYGLASSSWHWEHLGQLHPELTASELHGPGGKVGRVRRWLSANAGHPVLLERFELAAELGLRACAGGLYLRSGAACDQPAPQDLVAMKILARNLRVLGQGSPSAAGAIAETAYFVGTSLWRVGQARAAFLTLLAGVPSDMQPSGPPPSAAVGNLPPLSAPLPAWRRTAALGDPARNLFVAAGMLLAAGEAQAAAPYLQAAARDGLPEAQPQP